MVWVPLDSIHCEVMVLVSLQVLSTEGLGAEMDQTFLSSNKIEMFFILVEVEAHTTGETIDELLLLVVGKFLLLVDDKLELGDLLGLELVLHEVPVGDTTI